MKCAVRKQILPYQKTFKPIQWTFPSAATLISAAPLDNHCLLDPSGSFLPDLHIETVINKKKAPVYISPIKHYGKH